MFHLEEYLVGWKNEDFQNEIGEKAAFSDLSSRGEFFFF